MARPRNEQCPKRGIGLSHAHDDTPKCMHCGVYTFDPADPISALRVKFIEALAGIKTEAPVEDAEAPEDMPPGDPAEPGWCQAGKGHWSTSTWLVPNDGRHYCAVHLRRIVEVGAWKR